jgi:hypothetical protein
MRTRGSYGTAVYARSMAGAGEMGPAIQFTHQVAALARDAAGGHGLRVI